MKNKILVSVYAFLYLPLIILVLWSFNDSHYSLLWHGFTLKWYQRLFHNREIITAAFHSLLLACLASTLACVLGTLASLCLFRTKFNGKRFLHVLLFIMIVAPDIIIAVSMTLLFRLLPITPGFTTLFIAHTTFCMPFVAIIVYARFSEFNPHLIEAAKDLGASEFTILRAIILPLMWPAITAAWILSFSLSMDDVIISYFVSGPSFEILPLTIFGLVRVGVTPEINALCTIILIITLLLIFSSQLLARKKCRAHK
jgi:spermidine/putrescine transport system permease protein